METIEKIFSDNTGNHLLVALYLYDTEYKQDTLYIPAEYDYIEVIDINIEKVILDKPIHPAVFFKMSTWLLQQFREHKDSILSFICSIEELPTNHPEDLPQLYRWNLFDRLYQRLVGRDPMKFQNINVQDVIVGPEGYQSYGRIFYRDGHAPIINIVISHLRDKQS